MRSGDLKIWLNHFEHHGHPRCVAQDVPDVLTPDERKLIAGSIATYQLGEQSEGRSLVRAAERLAREQQLPHLVRIMELLVREEQRHAALLRAFMQDHEIPLKRSDWTDRIFRLLRRLAGFRHQVCVIICAELIGNVYYRALESITGCERLRVLCRTLVSDELAHVGFESQLLCTLRAGRAARFWASIRPHQMLFVCTAAVVWLTHRCVLRRAGHSAGSFLRACQAQYTFYLEPTGAPAGVLSAGQS
jgi:hypothetical protein